MQTLLRSARAIAETFADYARPGSPVAQAGGNIADAGPQPVPMPTLEPTPTPTPTPTPPPAAGLDLTGTAGADRLVGSALSDRLDGGAGRDRLHGGAGDDWRKGGGDRDTLLGGAGSDDLQGGAGDGVRRGDADHDGLTGGAGVDSFIFARGDGPDWIVDFEAGVEMLRLEGIAADEVPQTLKSYWEHEGLELTFGDGDQIYLQGVTAPLAERDLVFGCPCRPLLRGRGGGGTGPIAVVPP